MDEINIPGLAVILIFYLLILGIGVWAAWKRRSRKTDTTEVMLAGREFGPFIGLMTLTATWVGGGYINGSAEAMYSSGLVWCQAPFGYSASIFLNGLFFAKKMREAGYVTMLDPLQDTFGKRWGSALFFPALAGEMLWSASILAALGLTLAVILNIDSNVSIIVSTVIAVTYTVFGGLASVAYTDVVQLICIFIGLWLTVPFAMLNESVASLHPSETDWAGSIPAGDPSWGTWIDYYVLLVLGGIPWQVYYQRALAAKSGRQAQILSYAASFGCIFMVIPALFIGAIAKATDWESTSYNSTIDPKDKAMILPLVMQHLTPSWVAFIGLGAVSAAVMSSADSSVLSSSTMFARNIYENVFRPKASEAEKIWVMRGSVVVFAAGSCALAIFSKSVYELFYLCGDFVYVMLFPQLTLAVHTPNYVNTYGSIVAYFVGFFIRILGGEPILGIPTVIKYPWYDEETETQNFPFRTLAMLVTLVCLWLFSWITEKLFTNGAVSSSWDVLGVFSKDSLIKNGRKEVGGIENPALDERPDSHLPPPTYKKAVGMTAF